MYLAGPVNIDFGGEESHRLDRPQSTDASQPCRREAVVSFNSLRAIELRFVHSGTK